MRIVGVGVTTYGGLSSTGVLGMSPVDDPRRARTLPPASAGPNSLPPGCSCGC